MSVYEPPLCMKCKHRNERTVDMTCTAYPKKIPDAIIESKVDHRKPYKGDNGIQYEPKRGG